MKLYLAQHGEAQSKELDPERSLTNKGKHDVERVANFLQSAQIHVDKVIHSGKLRAEQTASILAFSIADGASLEVSENLSPNDDPDIFIKSIESVNKDTLVVGHLPFMAKLVSLLLTLNDSNKICTFQPGSIICLEKIDATWSLNWMLRPELLNEL